MSTIWGIKYADLRLEFARVCTGALDAGPETTPSFRLSKGMNGRKTHQIVCTQYASVNPKFAKCRDEDALAKLFNARSDRLHIVPAHGN